MKTSLLWILSTLLHTSAYNGGPMTCCFHLYVREIRANRIKSYAVTDKRCPKETVIFETQQGKMIFVDPNSRWVQKIIKKLDSAASSSPENNVTSSVSEQATPRPSVTASLASTTQLVPSLEHDVTTACSTSEQVTPLPSGPSRLLWLLLAPVAVVMTSVLVFLICRKKRTNIMDQGTTVNTRRSRSETELYDDVGPVSADRIYQSLCVDTMDQNQIYSGIRDTQL